MKLLKILQLALFNIKQLLFFRDIINKDFIHKIKISF